MTPPEVTHFPVLKTTSIVGPTVSVVPLSLPRETGLNAIVSPQKDTVQRFRKPLRHLVYSGGLTDVSASLYRGDALLFGLAALRFDYAGRYHFGLGVGTRKSIHPNVSVQLEVLQSAFVLEQSYVKLGHWWTTSLHPILNLTPAPGMDVFVMPALRLNYGNRFAHSSLECVPGANMRMSPSAALLYWLTKSAVFTEYVAANPLSCDAISISITHVERCFFFMV